MRSDGRCWRSKKGTTIQCAFLPLDDIIGLFVSIGWPDLRPISAFGSTLWTRRCGLAMSTHRGQSRHEHGTNARRYDFSFGHRRGETGRQDGGHLVGRPRYGSVTVRRDGLPTRAGPEDQRQWFSRYENRVRIAAHVAVWPEADISRTIALAVLIPGRASGLVLEPSGVTSRPRLEQREKTPPRLAAR
jgi:hypothetical protein